MMAPVEVEPSQSAAQFLAPSDDPTWTSSYALAGSMLPVSADTALGKPDSPRPAPEPSALSVLAAAVCSAALVRWRGTVKLGGIRVVETEIGPIIRM
jgi:hypothetical protein